MSLRDWWRNRSGRAKAVTVLATLLILQIGLCFGTPSIMDSFRTVFHLGGNPWDAEGYMVLEAMFCVVTLLALLIVPLFWSPWQDPQTLFGNSDDERDDSGNAP